MSSVDCVFLYNLLVDTGRQKLVIDVRPFDAYADSFIRGSLSYPASLFETGVPSAGKKFQSMNSTGEDPEWTEKEDKSLALRGILYQTCLLYDDAGDASGPAALLASLLQKEGKFTSISYLSGGLQAFHKAKPFLISSAKAKKRSLDGPLASEIIQDFLFLGSAENASSIDQLRALGITHILNMADELVPHMTIPIDQFAYMKCSLDDTVSDRLDSHVEDALNFIDKCRSEKGKILVHCAMGISRSSAITIAYLMRSCKQSFDEAFKHVKARRSIIKPNPGFVEQLRKLDGHWETKSQ